MEIVTIHSRETYQATSIMRWDMGIFSWLIATSNVDIGSLEPMVDSRWYHNGCKLVTDQLLSKPHQGYVYQTSSCSPELDQLRFGAKSQVIRVPLVLIHFRSAFSMISAIQLWGYPHDELDTSILPRSLPSTWLGNRSGHRPKWAGKLGSSLGMEVFNEKFRGKIMGRIMGKRMGHLLEEWSLRTFGFAICHWGGFSNTQRLSCRKRYL